MILDTIQQIPMDSVLDCLEGTTHNKVISTPVLKGWIVVPGEIRCPPIPFREYKVKSVRKGRGFYWVRVETLGEMNERQRYTLYLDDLSGRWARCVESQMVKFLKSGA